MRYFLLVTALLMGTFASAAELQLGIRSGNAYEVLVTTDSGYTGYAVLGEYAYSATLPPMAYKQTVDSELRIVGFGFPLRDKLSLLVGVTEGRAIVRTYTTPDRHTTNTDKEYGVDLMLRYRFTERLTYGLGYNTVSDAVVTSLSFSF